MNLSLLRTAKHLTFAITALVLAANPGFASKTERDDKSHDSSEMFDVPIKGIGRVVIVDKADEYWLLLEDDEVKDRIVNEFNTRTLLGLETHPNGSAAIKVRLMGISIPQYNLTKNKMGVPSPVIKEVSNAVPSEIKSREVVFHCYGRDKRRIALCSIYVNGTDYGYSLLLRGYSKYNKLYGDHPVHHDQYRNAAASAKQQEAGIWAPYYEFLYPDE